MEDVIDALIALVLLIAGAFAAYWRITKEK